MDQARWNALKAEAQRVIDATLAELPAEILVEAREVPLLFEMESPDDPDLLGVYENLLTDEAGLGNGPIILYLETIALFCEDKGLPFSDEVRVTYLHELGHHFGWDEEDLEARGLE
jgi:predicted Zn-dependent protease with MMP-like domain